MLIKLNNVLPKLNETSCSVNEKYILLYFRLSCNYNNLNAYILEIME